jgi:membrane-bound serine protease (ClpP class)
VLLLGAILLAVFVLPPGWDLAVIAVAALVEVAETAFWIHLSRRRPAAVGAEVLIGAVAEVVTPCRPAGQVRIAGELWQATCRAGADPGERVRVVDRDGLVLEVEPPAAQT